MSKLLQGLETEMRLLGGALVDVDWATRVVQRILVSNFLDPRNRIIFDQIKKRVETDQKVNLDIIIDLVACKECPIEYLVSVFEVGSLRSVDFDELVEGLKLQYFKHRMFVICQDVCSNIAESTMPEDDYTRALFENILSIHGDVNRKKAADIVWNILNKPTPLLDQIQEVQDRFRAGETIFEGIPTGFVDFDSHINSLKGGHLTIIGARPSVGKTTFATNLIENICLRSDESCLFFSLEMPAEEIAKKLVYQIAEISGDKVARGAVTGDEFQAINQANRALFAKNIIIEDQPSLGIDQIKLRSIRAKKSHNIKFIVIDYLQRITSPKRAENRQVEIAFIAGQLKEIAKTLDIPIVALAQLNRDSEKRDSPKPLMSDLRESGAIEADADEILLLHRPDLYDIHDKPGLMECHLVKNRFGQTGMFHLVFRKDIGKMSNYAKIKPF